MAAAMASAGLGRISCVVVFDDPALFGKNRIAEKLTERGLTIARSCPATARPTSLEDVGAVIVQGKIREGDYAWWKARADERAARFFRLPHQVSHVEWRGLEDWIARTLVGAKTPSEPPAPPSYRDADTRASEERRARLLSDAEVERLRVELATLERKGETATTEIRSAMKERDGLREQVRAADERIARMAREHESKRRADAEQIARLTETVEALHRGQDKLRDERDQAIASARKAKAAPVAPPVTPAEVLVCVALGLDDDAKLYAGKLAAGLADGILTAAEVKTKLLARIKSE